MKTSQQGIDLIKKWESFQPLPYKCAAGVWTIGYGHTKGDERLVQLADHIRNLRRYDIPSRYSKDEHDENGYRCGGEEFRILLPGASLGGAVIATERVREDIEKMEPILYAEIDGRQTQIGTMSFGVASFPYEGIKTAGDLVNAADSALYLAKDTGRNRVCTYEALRNLKE